MVTVLETRPPYTCDECGREKPFVYEDESGMKYCPYCWTYRR